MKLCGIVPWKEILQTVKSKVQNVLFAFTRNEPFNIFNKYKSLRFFSIVIILFHSTTVIKKKISPVPPVWWKDSQCIYPVLLALWAVIKKTVTMYLPLFGEFGILQLWLEILHLVGQRCSLLVPQELGSLVLRCRILSFLRRHTTFTFTYKAS